jgi:16S rRNA (adenine1518-N6/adenine1519-N6)-dimethyltransferase
MLNYDSVAELRRFLQDRGMGMQKKFGQNFMINPSVREKIVSLMPPLDGSQVWEVGPGLGAITRLMLDRGAGLTVFEIDRGFISALKEIFAVELEDGRLGIIEGDAKKTLKVQPSTPDFIVGNLPYNVGSAIIADLISSGAGAFPMVFTLQREVVDRICASPGDKEYGSFSMLCQYAMKAENCGTISSASFYPAPEVQSAIVRLSPLHGGTDFPSPAELNLLDRFLRMIFSSRRKTLYNNIRRGAAAPGGTGPDAADYLAALEQAGIDPAARAESLSVADVRRIISSIA